MHLVAEEEHSDDEQQQKRRRWRLHLDNVKAEWSVSGGLTLAGGGFAGAVLVVLACLIFNQPQHQSQSQSQAPPFTTVVQREPISSPGVNPFMPPVGRDQPNITPLPHTGGAFSGNTSGLFGETGDKPSCDAQSLVANLQADPAKENAWADALGLHSEDVPSYVASLIPVVLRSDTAVTSYGYADGHFLAYPAVLQAGTAVFINSYGEPKAKCFSGNPLTAALTYPQVSYVGSPWQNFQPTSITVINRTTTVINKYTFVNIIKGTTVYRPAPRPQYKDDNWYCKKHPDADNCQGSTRGTPAIVPAPPATTTATATPTTTETPTTIKTPAIPPIIKTSAPPTPTTTTTIPTPTTPTKTPTHTTTTKTPLPPQPPHHSVSREEAVAVCEVAAEASVDSGAVRSPGQAQRRQSKPVGLRSS